jgi:hypothetical protein
LPCAPRCEKQFLLRLGCEQAKGEGTMALGLQLMLGGMSGLIAQGVFTAPGN